MRRFAIYICAIVICVYMLGSCSKGKGNLPDLPSNENPNAGVTTGNMTDYKGYVVKTVGVSRIMIAVDDQRKLTLAYLYGGGNKIVLKAGTGNTVETKQVYLNTLPDAVTYGPDATITHSNSDIDNGKMPDTAGSGAVFKLRGFDKSKTGYNQLNVVMSKYFFPAYALPGYYPNLVYLKFNMETGKKNADYGTAFITQLFTGNIKVSSVELAKPLSENPSISEDWVINNSQAVYSTSDKKGIEVDLAFNGYFRFLSATNNLGAEIHPFARNLKAEWVNADNATVTKADDQVYLARFGNMKIGGYDQVVEPSDTISKAFIRITGFNRADFGFNQLRLFPAETGYYKGDVRLFYTDKPATAPNLSFIKDVYKTGGLTCILASPNWPHY